MGLSGEMLERLLVEIEQKVRQGQYPTEEEIQTALQLTAQSKNPMFEVVGKGWSNPVFHLRALGDGVSLCGVRVLKNAELGAGLLGAGLDALRERTTCGACRARLEALAQEFQQHLAEGERLLRAVIENQWRAEGR